MTVRKSTVYRLKKKVEVRGLAECKCAAVTSSEASVTVHAWQIKLQKFPQHGRLVARHLLLLKALTSMTPVGS